MSDYGSLYLIETNYNSERDATEVIFGYMQKEKKLAGRIMSVRAIVNIPGCGDNEKKAIEKGLVQARKLLESSSIAPYDED
ncbi:MAG: hypothetical protein WBB48_00835 [Thermodesulfobacteriota bacterium]